MQKLNAKLNPLTGEEKKSTLKTSVLKKLLLFIGIASSIITIFVFISGKASIPELTDTLLKKQAPQPHINNENINNLTATKKSYVKKLTSLATAYQKNQMGFYDFSTPQSKCVYPDASNISAPSWICEYFEKNIPFAFVGTELIGKDNDKERAIHEAYIQALTQLAQSTKIHIESRLY